MKKILFAFFLCCFSLTLFAQSQPDCGAIDCPGRCGRFVDQNGDGFCDHGRLSAPTTTTQTSATPVENKENSSSKEQTPATTSSTKKQSQPTKTERTDKIATEQENPTAAVETTETPSPKSNIETVEPEPVKAKKPYDLILISALTLGLYAITFILVKANKMKKATHRKIWNIMLLITALVSCLLGFFLVIQINYNLKMDWLWTVKLYHVQFGISMTIIAVIHIFWHINYWKSYFKKQ